MGEIHVTHISYTINYSKDRDGEYGFALCYFMCYCRLCLVWNSKKKFVKRIYGATFVDICVLTCSPSGEFIGTFACDGQCAGLCPQCKIDWVHRIAVFLFWSLKHPLLVSQSVHLPSSFSPFPISSRLWCSCILSLHDVAHCLWSCSLVSPRQPPISISPRFLSPSLPQFDLHSSPGKLQLPAVPPLRATERENNSRISISGWFICFS